MSQLIVCQNSHGVLMAADSQAPGVEPGGEVRQTTVKRVVELSSHAVILAGGAADGVEMSRALKQFVSEEAISDVQDIFDAARPFLATEFERVMRRKCEVLPVDPVHQVHFILGGYTARDARRPYRLYLFWTKHKLQRLAGDELGVAYAVPRLVGLEYRLERSCHGDVPLEDVLPEVRASMEEQGAENREIGPPFSYTLVTAEGVRHLT